MFGSQFPALPCPHGEQVAVFTAASESFSRANINCSIQESLDRFKPLVDKAAEARLPVRGYVSCVLGCPYEGRVPPEDVAKVSMLRQGAFDFDANMVPLSCTVELTSRSKKW